MEREPAAFALGIGATLGFRDLTRDVVAAKADLALQAAPHSQLVARHALVVLGV